MTGNLGLLVGRCKKALKRAAIRAARRLGLDIRAQVLPRAPLGAVVAICHSEPRSLTPVVPDGHWLN